MKEEYSALRSEIIHWQERRLIFAQVALTLVIGYTGYLIKDDSKSTIAWPIVAAPPLIANTQKQKLIYINQWLSIRRGRVRPRNSAPAPGPR